MISYKDKTFCTFHLECKDGSNCSRAITQQVIDSAIKWWGNDTPPICVFIDKPECYESNTG